MKQTGRYSHRHRKIILLLMCVLCMPAAMALNPEMKVSLHLEDAEIQQFLREVEQTTGYLFIYGQEVKLSGTVTMDAHNRPLKELLKQVLDSRKIDFYFKGKHIILQQKEIKTVSRKYTISGYITDGTSRETLIGANIFESRQSQGTTTNPYGFYSLTLPGGELELTYSYIGYEPRTYRFTLSADTVVNIRMVDNNQLQEVVIVSDKAETGFKATQMGAVDIPLNHIRNTPGVLGEADVLKSIQLTPGVQGGTEGTAGIHVRGGGPDQNLILLDGVPLYHVEHLFGFFSVFTPEAVKKVQFFKGSFPARFGGRLSSVVDVRTNDGDMQRYHGSFSLGLLSTKVHLEGPIVKDRTSFIFSARRSYLDLLIRPFFDDDQKGGYYFYDVNAKINHRFNDRSRLFLSLYHGKDRYFYKYDSREKNTFVVPDDEGLYYGNTGTIDVTTKMKDKQILDWGNMVAAARWNYIFSNKLFSNTTLAFNRFHFKMNFLSEQKYIYGPYTEESTFDSKYMSGIEDLTYNMDFDYNPSPNHHVKFGGSYLYHTFKPEVLSSHIKETELSQAQDTTYNLIPSTHIYAHEASVYIEDNFNLGAKIQVNAGAHASLFHVQDKSYFSVQPRLSARYQPVEGVAIKASYTKMNQYIHLLSSSMISMPTDLWVPVTKEIKPMRAHQYSLGAYYNGVAGWEFSVEGYYKDMRNVLEYKDGTSFLGNSFNWEQKVEMGKGRAYGVEFQAQKQVGRTTGWISYTLAKADRKFEKGSINDGKRFPYKYDRRHTVNATLSHRFSKRIDIHASWVFATGHTTTLSEEQTMAIFPRGSNDRYSYYRYSFWGTGDHNLPAVLQRDHIEARNNYRLPASHRLNVGVNFRKQTKHGERIWNISLYNAYNAMNPNMVYWDLNDKDEEVLKKITILPCIPSVTYTYKF